jgi:glycosyltransferase involved in cell wall biosynthesis
MTTQEPTAVALPEISIVSPVYRAEGMVHELVARITAAVEGMGVDFEIILVEDGSPDRSWEDIAAECSRDKRVRGLRLSRNFGQHRAITAGLDHARGRWTVVMDCDLQDRPEEIPRLYARAQKGYDIVVASRHGRTDGLLKRLSSSIFYRTLGYLTGTRQDASVGNFGIYSQRVVREICSMRESIRYFPTMVQWVGFERHRMPVEHATRTKGASSYSFGKLFQLALDIMLATSDKPLRLTVQFGFIVAGIGLLTAAWTFVNWWLGNLEANPLGYASLFFSLWLLSGFILITLGMVGLYVGKTFEGVKNRPIYIVREEL